MNLKFITLILCITTLFSGYSQISTINLKEYTGNFRPQIKIIDSKIYITLKNGLYSKNLIDITDKRKLWETNFKGIALNDFCINEQDIIATADQFYLNKNLIIYSEDLGKSINISTPKDIYPSIDVEGIKYEQNIGVLSQNSLNKNEIFANGWYSLYKSVDFGKSWEQILDWYDIKSIAHSPLQNGTIIIGHNLFTDCDNNSSYMISFDSGNSWKNTQSIFLSATGIAFHPSDPNIIVLAGGNVVKSSDGGHSWDEMINDIHSYDQGGIDDITFDLREGNRLFGTSQGKGMMYSDDFGKTWNEYYPIPTENSKIADFEQYGSKLYILMADYTLYELDLELIDSAVEEVAEDSLSLTISADTLQFSSASEIEQVEIYSADGMLLHSAESNANDGNIDISALSAGVHIAVFTTSDGQTISKKIIKSV